MRHFFLLGTLLFSLLFFGLFTRTSEPLAFLMPLMAYIGAGVIFGPEKIQMKIKRRLSSDRALKNESIDIRLEFINEGSRIEEIFLEDVLPESVKLLKGESSLLTSLDQGESLRLEYSIRTGRGDHVFNEVRVRISDSLGLFIREETLRSEGRLMVLPHIMKVKNIPIRPRRTRVYSGLIPSGTGGRGVCFFGVRNYQEGDPPRLINWKATARHSRLFFINEFEQERVADVGIILDARHRSYRGKKEELLFEHVVSATAAVAETLLSNGNRVGLYNYGRVVDWTFPGYGRIQKERILRSLVRARLGRHHVFEKLEHLPIRLFPAGSQLIFISPLQNDDKPTLLNLRARGYKVMVISPDRIAFEMARLRPDPSIEIAKRIMDIERRLIVNELRQAGVQVFNWPVDIPFHEAIALSMNRYSSIPV